MWPFSAITLGWSFERHNFNKYTKIEILLKKVLHEKCDPFFGENSYGPIDGHNLHNNSKIDILLKKVRYK